jgi:hypothetical protein
LLFLRFFAAPRFLVVDFDRLRGEDLALERLLFVLRLREVERVRLGFCIASSPASIFGFVNFLFRFGEAASIKTGASMLGMAYFKEKMLSLFFPI